MAKNGKKLGQLRCMIKRWHSSNRITHTSPILKPSESDNDMWQSASFHGNEVPSRHHPVYVGKSWRRYLVSSHIVEHPVFRNLLEVSGSGTGAEPMVVGCEVVLFEHLLWMLENADPKPEPLEEIVEFYAC